MTSAERGGSIAGLWRFPVKSMAGEALESVHLGPHGVVGDRAFAIIDAETGKVVTARSVKLVPGLLDCRGAYAEPPAPGRELPPVRITLPNGRVVTSDSPEADRTLSAYFGHALRLAAAAREEPTPSAFFGDIGVAPPAGPRAFVDLFPASLITTSTLGRMAELAPGSTFDARRFRMNVIVESAATGFPENDWIGRRVALGDAARLDVVVPDPRCVMTTLAQGGLPSDPDVLKALTRHNSREVGTGGLYPCAGVYALVGSPGSLRKGDRVSVV